MATAAGGTIDGSVLQAADTAVNRGVTVETRAATAHAEYMTLTVGGERGSRTGAGGPLLSRLRSRTQRIRAL